MAHAADPGFQQVSELIHVPGVTFVGRLARYQYLNMDQVVGQALSAFEKLADRLAVSA